MDTERGIHESTEDGEPSADIAMQEGGLLGLTYVTLRNIMANG